MRRVKSVVRLCGKGIRQYWGWFVKASENMGDYNGPW